MMFARIVVGTDGSETATEAVRRATDLALEHLRDALKKPREGDPLLEKLGWTREEAEAFLRRWDELKKGAQEDPRPDGDGARKLDDALGKLGLRPKATRDRATQRGGDQQRGVVEGRRSEPPLEYLDQFRAFSEGTAKGLGRADGK